MSDFPDVVLKCANAVESALEAKGICMTMGGEPTFISRRPDGDEWNTAAMGDEKLGYARRMARQLIDIDYAGSLVMQVFGKWYPGEPLPRWNCLLLHSAIGKPLWPETERLLLDDVAGQNEAVSAKDLIMNVAQRLGFERNVIPVYEADAEVDCSGYVLPLDFTESEGWFSDKWPYDERRRLKLFMGDSQVGLRLPLADLPDGALQCALTVEVRNGALEIFIPPLDWDAFQSLIAIIRELVMDADLGDVVICGYAPKSTHGELMTYGLAADPGVLEINLPPTKTWLAYNKVLTDAYRAASRVDLELVKYQLNGVVYGTGGGAHLAFGGEDLASNPFLGDPKRIASILRYWQHHPALSYFFSGQHVGPGSQAPRVDEGPNHGLYELEVACEGLEALVPPVDGVLIDQFLKNLLTDSSGNTHRAELCFDKFYNVAMANGCLGIIELRAFETYDTIESMSLAALFVRTILARLIENPFSEDLVRHGAALNDGYFLPSVLWQDIVEICRDLQQHGFVFKAEWLLPILQFRSPIIGELEFEGGSLIVRRAFESWPLMAEEGRGVNTVRVVDNSSDRIEVMLKDPSALEGSVLLVNGIRVPFSEVGDALVSGIRYKSASAYPALHPHVPIQSPLHLQWVDLESREVQRAAYYHYWNPHSPVYASRPLDAVEAASRRDERWIEDVASVGQVVSWEEPKRSPEYHYTLDLRRQLKASS